MNNIPCEKHDLAQRIYCAEETIATLEADNTALKREAAHWKNNHATVVWQARILKERTDMPLERVKAYEKVVELQRLHDALAEDNNRLHAAGSQVIQALEMLGRTTDAVAFLQARNRCETTMTALAVALLVNANSMKPTTLTEQPEA